MRETRAALNLSKLKSIQISCDLFKTVVTVVCFSFLQTAPYFQSIKSYTYFVAKFHAFVQASFQRFQSFRSNSNRFSARACFDSADGSCSGDLTRQSFRNYDSERFGYISVFRARRMAVAHALAHGRYGYLIFSIKVSRSKYSRMVSYCRVFAPSVTRPVYPSQCKTHRGTFRRATPTLRGLFRFVPRRNRFFVAFSYGGSKIRFPDRTWKRRARLSGSRTCREVKRADAKKKYSNDNGLNVPGEIHGRSFARFFEKNSQIFDEPSTSLRRAFLERKVSSIARKRSTFRERGRIGPWTFEFVFPRCLEPSGVLLIANASCFISREGTHRRKRTSREALIKISTAPTRTRQRLAVRVPVVEGGGKDGGRGSL